MFRIPKEIPERWKAARQVSKDDPKHIQTELLVYEKNREELLAMKAWLESWDAPPEIRRAFRARPKGRCLTPSTITMLSYAQWTAIGQSIGLNEANRKKVWLQIPSLRIDTGMAEESKMDFSGGSASSSGAAALTSPRGSVVSPGAKKKDDIAVVETMPSESLTAFFKKYKFSKIMIAKLLTEKRSLTGRLLSSLDVSMFDYMANEDINDLADEKGLTVIERLTLKFAINDYRREQRVRIRKRQIGWDVYGADSEFYDDDMVVNRNSRETSSVFFHSDRTDNAFAHLSASVKLWKQHIQRRMAEVNAKIGVSEEMANFGDLGVEIDDEVVAGGDEIIRERRKLRVEMPLSQVITKMRRAHAKHFAKNHGESSIHTWQELWIKEWNRTENGESIPAIWRNSPLDEDGREFDDDVGSISSVSGPTLTGSYDTADCSYEDFVVSMMGSGFERKEQMDYRQLRHEELMAKTKTMHLRKILPLNLASGVQKRRKVPTLTRTKTFQSVPPLSALLFDAATSNAAAASMAAGKLPLTLDTNASTMDDDSPMISKSAGGSKTLSHHTRAMTALPEGRTTSASTSAKRDSIGSVGSLGSGISRTLSHTNVLAGLTTPKSGGFMTPSNAAASFMFGGGGSTGPSGISAMSQFKSRRMAKQRAKMMQAEQRQRERDRRGGRKHKRSVTFSALSTEDIKVEEADTEEDSYSDEELDEPQEAKIKKGVSHASTPKSKTRSSGLSLKAMASEAIALESRESPVDQLSPGHKLRQVRRLRFNNDLMKEQYDIIVKGPFHQVTMHEVMDTDVFQSRSVSPIMCEPCIKSDEILTAKFDVKNTLLCIGVIESSALRMGLLISDIVERSSDVLTKTVWMRNHSWWQCKKKDMKGISSKKLRRYYKSCKWFGERENEDKMLDHIDAGVPIPMSKRWSKRSRVLNDDEDGEKRPDGLGEDDGDEWMMWKKLTFTVTVNMTSSIGLFKKRNPKRRGSETDVSDCESSSSSDIDEFEDSSNDTIDTDSEFDSDEEEEEEEEPAKKSRLTKRRMTIQCDGCPAMSLSIPYTWQKVHLFVCPDDPAGYLHCPIRLHTS